MSTVGVPVEEVAAVGTGIVVLETPIVGCKVGDPVSTPVGETENCCVGGREVGTCVGGRVGGGSIA